MRMQDWRRLFRLPKRHSVQTPESLPTSPSSQFTNQEVPTPVLELISSPPSPARTNEFPTPNPEPVSPLPPQTNQDAPTPVSHPVATSTPPPTKTTRDQEVQVPAPDPDTVSSPPPPAKTTSTNAVAKTVGNGLVVAVKLLKEAVTGVGVPGLEATVSGVVAVIDLIKDVRDNADDLGDLVGLISNLANAISLAPNLRKGVEVDALLRSRVDVLLSGLNDMMKQVQAMLGQNVASRTANSQAHKDAIQDIKAGINFLLNQFTVHGTLSLEVNMAGARQEIRMLKQAQEAFVLARESEDLIKGIPRADARYCDTTTKPSRPCQPGTRKGLLETIVNWIVVDPDAKPYFWLCGEVGVGKSTVAHSIAQEQEAAGRLGASFFFSRHDDTRQNPRHLFTSIAYQLARFDHGFYEALAKVLKPDPDIVKRSPMEQFKRLVLQPLANSSMDPSQTVVIVIDGLDECSDPALILDVLTSGVDDVGVRLRVLISSRPYATILSKFKDPRLYHLTSESQFHDINPETLSSDVAIFLSWSLGDLASRWRLRSPWPPKDQLHELIKRAAGLMIVASTYTKYIDDPEVGNPARQLARIMSRERGMGSSPLAELDALYDQILGDLKSRLVSDSQVVNARDFIAFVILAPSGIDVSALAGLFGVDPFDVRLVLRRLTAVILLPEDDSGNIAPFHASFGEYICDSMRCTIRELAIDAEGAYGRIVARCSDAIISAADNGVIGVEYSSARGDSWTPAYLRHSAHHLPHYLSRSPAGVNVLGVRIWPMLPLKMFSGFDRNFLAWIDALGKPTELQHVKGSSENEIYASLVDLMVSQFTSEINQMSEKAKATRGTIQIEASGPDQWSAIKFANVGLDYYPEAWGGLTIVRDVRCWTKYTHKNVMSFGGVNIKFNQDNVPQEVLVLVESPNNILHSSGLYEQLKNKNELDIVSRVRMALGIADGLCYLHGSFPPQPHNGVNPHQIIVCGEGQPVLYPSAWTLHFQRTATPNEKDEVDEVTGHWNSISWYPTWYHWNPDKGYGWRNSLEARLQVDVWDFGSILYQMITREEPLTTYTRLAEGNQALSYEPPTRKPNPGYREDPWDNPWDISRYEAAVPLLLSTLEASEDIKILLRSCWTILPQDRPPMSEVFERLKSIVEATET